LSGLGILESRSDHLPIQNFRKAVLFIPAGGAHQFVLLMKGGFDDGDTELDNLQATYSSCLRIRRLRIRQGQGIRPFHLGYSA